MGGSRFNGADLSFAPLKWRLMRAEYLIKLKFYDDAMKILRYYKVFNSSEMIGQRSTDVEALTTRAYLVFLTDSHPTPKMMQLLQQILSFDPDCAKAIKLLKKIKALENIKKQGNDAFSNSDWAVAEQAYTQWLETDVDHGVGKVKILSNRDTVACKVKRVIDLIRRVGIQKRLKIVTKHLNCWKNIHSRVLILPLSLLIWPILSTVPSF